MFLWDLKNTMTGDKQAPAEEYELLCKRCKYNVTVQSRGKVEKAYCTGKSGEHHAEQEMVVNKK